MIIIIYVIFWAAVFKTKKKKNYIFPQRKIGDLVQQFKYRTLNQKTIVGLMTKQ